MTIDMADSAYAVYDQDAGPNHEKADENSSNDEHGDQRSEQQNHYSMCKGGVPVRHCWLVGLVLFYGMRAG